MERRTIEQKAQTIHKELDRYPLLKRFLEMNQTKLTEDNAQDILRAHNYSPARDGQVAAFAREMENMNGWPKSTYNVKPDTRRRYLNAWVSSGDSKKLTFSTDERAE